MVWDKTLKENPCLHVALIPFLIPFSKPDSETWDPLPYSPNFLHFCGVGRVGPERFPSPEQQIEQQQPSCALCRTYHPLWVNTGSWHLKMETNKPGISTIREQWWCSSCPASAQLPAALCRDTGKKRSQHFSKRELMASSLCIHPGAVFGHKKQAVRIFCYPIFKSGLKACAEEVCVRTQPQLWQFSLEQGLPTGSGKCLSDSKL